MLYRLKIKLWNLLASAYPAYLRWRFDMKIGKNVRISYKARLDKTINSKGIHIGDCSWILAYAMILAHDHSRGMKKDTYIGSRCIIGVSSIIMPGVKIGDQVVIGAGSVVTKDIPSHCMAAGNPAKVIREDICVGTNGKIIKS